MRKTAHLFFFFSATVWDIVFFNEYLRGKQFILYMDNNPLKKLVHLHSKLLNRLQTALLEHDFVIQYKKGSNMPVDPDFPAPQNPLPAFLPWIHFKLTSSTSR
jgi:hypothetical protein